jgi:UDP-3-O-[3-hydroxymyristoyl] glucosamine N-acyltransferase LpxD
MFNRLSYNFKRNTLTSNEITNINIKIKELRINSEFEINDVSSYDNIKKNSVFFIQKEVSIPNNNYLVFITDKKNIFKNKNYKNIILVDDINIAYKNIIDFMYIHEDNIEYKDSFKKKFNSYISDDAVIHSSTIIGNNCVIGKGVEIGKKCIIKNNVIIKNSLLKDNVCVSDNSTIGSTGFGFSLSKLGFDNLSPHIGNVIIEENVSIGSNCCIDRGKIDSTIIGKNSIIDNLVHIAHNVIIGENACIAAQSGFSGSLIIGNNLLCGGQSGFAGHIKIGNNVTVAAKSGVTKNIYDNSTVAGFPATDIKEWKKQIINQKKNGHK